MGKTNSGKKLAITISKFNRGSLSQNEIKISVEYFTNVLFKSALTLVIVNEHFNNKQEPFEHLHVFVELTDEKRTDNITQNIKKNLTFLFHVKDVVTKINYSDGWMNYISKSDNKTILFMKGITEGDIEEHKKEFESHIKTTKKGYNQVVKMRVSPSDLPYVMLNYIKEKQYDYNGSITYFTQILSDMLDDNYDFQIKGKMKETFVKLNRELGDKKSFFKFIQDDMDIAELLSTDELVKPRLMIQTDLNNFIIKENKEIIENDSESEFEVEIPI